MAAYLTTWRTLLAFVNPNPEWRKLSVVPSEIVANPEDRSYHSGIRKWTNFTHEKTKTYVDRTEKFESDALETGKTPKIGRDHSATYWDRFEVSAHSTRNYAISGRAWIELNSMSFEDYTWDSHFCLHDDSKRWVTNTLLARDQYQLKKRVLLMNVQRIFICLRNQQLTLRHQT